MISISLIVMLLATYAYSVPVGMNENISKQNVQVSTSQPRIMHLIDDGETTVVPTGDQDSFTTSRDGLRLTTQGSLVNNKHVPREMLEPLASSQVEMLSRGIEESSTVYPDTVESSSQSERLPRGMEGSSTLVPTTVESSSQSGLSPRGIVESSTLVPSVFETSTEFHQRTIRGGNVQYGRNLQTTEVPPTSSVSSFAQTTGLLRPLRGEQEEGQESSSMSMDDATTELLATEQSKTSIEIIPGSNTKTEIIPGPNTKTEIISGANTKTEIVTGGSGRLVGGKQPLSQGKN